MVTERLWVAAGMIRRMDVGQVVQYSDTCALGASAEHRAWMREWMNRMMQVAAWTQDLRVEPIDDAESVQPVAWSTTLQGWATRSECLESGDRWNPDLERVTRHYRVLPGPRGECPL